MATSKGTSRSISDCRLLLKFESWFSNVSGADSDSLDETTTWNPAMTRELELCSQSTRVLAIGLGIDSQMKSVCLLFRTFSFETSE